MKIYFYRYIQPRYGVNYPDLILDKCFTEIEHKRLTKEMIEDMMEKEMKNSPQFNSRYIPTFRGYGEEYENEILEEIEECETPIFKFIGVG